LGQLLIKPDFKLGYFVDRFNCCSTDHSTFPNWFEMDTFFQIEYHFTFKAVANNQTIVFK
jgi:hypothetical protein